MAWELRKVYTTSMLRPRPASHNKRIRESSLLSAYPHLAGTAVLKINRQPNGIKYLLFNKVSETYYIAFIGFDGSGELRGTHQGRVEDLDSLFGEG